MTGIVKHWNIQKGFGHIAPDEGGDDVFVSYANVRLPGFKLNPYQGEKVSFEKRTNEKGDFADNVTLLTDSLERGRVKEFDGNEGLIQPEAGGDAISFESFDIASRGYPEFEEDERVSFRSTRFVRFQGPFASKKLICGGRSKNSLCYSNWTIPLTGSRNSPAKVGITDKTP